MSWMLKASLPSSTSRERRRPHFSTPAAGQISRTIVLALFLCWIGYARLLKAAAASTSTPASSPTTTLEELNRDIAAEPFSSTQWATLPASSTSGGRGGRNSTSDVHHLPNRFRLQSEEHQRIWRPPSNLSSTCAADFTCPRQSAVWASGTFTTAELLTPHSLSLPPGLVLQLSLCCRYQFYGSMLRDVELYDAFLLELLQASPLQALSAAEKRELFPREAATLVDTRRHRIVGVDEGDGDVLVLVTGAVPLEALAKIAVAPPGLSEPMMTPDNAGEVERRAASWVDEASSLTTEAASFDLQLRITSRVLKCKCPHILMVMPPLRLSADALPPIAIRGLGPHCGVSPATGGKATTSLPPNYIVQTAHGEEGLEQFATSFEVDQLIPPMTMVTWTVRRGGPSPPSPLPPAPEQRRSARDEAAATSEMDENVVLHHSRLLPVKLDPISGEVLYSFAACPYFTVEPNTYYEVEVELQRGVAPLPVARQVARGFFVLRLPLDRHWSLPPQAAAPHFGFQRSIRLGEATRARPEVAAALDPNWGQAAPSRSWFSGAADSAARQPSRPLAYYGYWEVTAGGAEVGEYTDLPPISAPQQRRIRHNPFESPSLPVALSMGRNTLVFHVQDIDHVCPAVALEEQEVWALQSIITTANPITACAEEQAIEAVVLRHLLLHMRLVAPPRFQINLPQTSWDALAPHAKAAREGRYRCRPRKGGPSSGLPSRQRWLDADETDDCAARPDLSRDASEAFGVLRMRHRGTFEVVWTITLEVRDAALLAAENFDPLYATVVPLPSGATADATASYVEILSRTHFVVRRISTYPSFVKMELPMHARRWTVQAPAPLSSGSSTAGSVATADALGVGETTGTWVAQSPLAVLSIDEHHLLELDTGAVPNVQRILPNGTLRFIAEDAGEEIFFDDIDAAMLGMHQGQLQRSYRARCPVATIEYIVSVVALPAPPLLPPYTTVYTEDACVLLLPPRETFKDESAEWRVLPCEGAPSVPYLIQRPLSDEEAMTIITTSVNGGAAVATLQPPLRHPAMGQLACGIEPYHHCSVVWSATNLAGTVQKEYSLRRCQRPPDLLLHANGLQQSTSYPPGVFALPSILETIYLPARTNETSGAAGEAASVLLTPSTRHRRIIPVAGYTQDMGYSFNFTGPQNSFDVDLHPDHNAAANQLNNTRRLHRRDDAGDYFESPPPLVLRRQSRTELQSAPLMGKIEVARGAGKNDNRAAGVAALERSHPSIPSSSSGDNEKGGEDGWATAQRPYMLDRQIDEALGSAFVLRQQVVERSLQLDGLGHSSLYPVDYTIHATQTSRRQGAAEDWPEFERRGMCVERHGYAAVLAVSPRGVIREDERYGVTLPPPPAPAVAVLPFCQPQFIFSRHDDLATRFGYDFTWVCPDATVIAVEKRSSVYSILSHVPEVAGHANGDGGRATTTGAVCQLTVANRVTQTEQRDWIFVLRVQPSQLSSTSLVILSDNSAATLLLPASSSSRARGRRPAEAGQPSLSAQSSALGSRTVSIEQLYAAEPNVFPFSKAHRIVGKTAVLHVDSPSHPHLARWSVESVVPTSPSAVGTQVIMDAIEFYRLDRHPAAIARGNGGSTVLVKGLHTPGLYRIRHELPDPLHPDICPAVILTDTLEVFHARVVVRELFICGDTAGLQAVPLPRELSVDFVGQWEVVSHATDADTTWTEAENFSGIEFEQESRPKTLVHGLPFGIVTVRWAIYRLLPITGEARAGDTTAEKISWAPQRRVLVDFDTVQVYVLTENLPSRRLVTLSHQATILTTSSTRNWQLNETARPPGQPPVQLLHTSLFRNADSAAAGSGDETTVDRELLTLYTYHGRAPLYGSGLLSLYPLPVGSIHLTYDLVPSQNVFGAMVGHTCQLQGHYEVERVSAYVTATTNMNHECDSYTGRGRITICLHAEAAVSMAEGKASAAQGWKEQVRLIAPDRLEEVMKHGAREVERLSGGQCQAPWWTWGSTRWTSIDYDELASAATFQERPQAGTASTSSKPAQHAIIPGRCISFYATADRHLSPHEAMQPLFRAVALPTAGAVVSSQSSTRGHSAEWWPSSDAMADRNLAALPSAAEPSPRSTGSSASQCPYHGDFISSYIIEGSSGVTMDATESRKPSSSSSSFLHWDGGHHFFDMAQLFHLGIFSSLGQPADEASSSVGVRAMSFMPVLSAATRQRSNATMRALVGLHGVGDDVMTELDVSEGNASLVTLGLDWTHPHLLGGFVLYRDGHGDSSATGREEAKPATGPSPSFSLPKSLLLRCMEGTVRGVDVLQYWTETNRPDGRIDLTALEWLSYVDAVQDEVVPCTIMFPSLEHVIAETYDYPSSYPWQWRRSGRPASSSSSSPSSPSQRVPPRDIRLVSLEEMEQQVERIRRSNQWTRDGIDVTGLRSDLQEALSRRRITSTQLQTIMEARHVRQATEAEQEQQRHQRGLQNAPSQETPAERLRTALDAYYSIYPSDAPAIQLRLPRHGAFTTPYDLFLRTALHKDVICGTSIAPPPTLRGPTVPLISNPHSLVAFGRVEITDVAPQLLVHPYTIKQCEVEGGVPLLTLELTGGVFRSGPAVPSPVVFLEEVANPHVPMSAGHPEVGLQACVEAMQAGLNVAVAAGTRKHLYLQLGSCPWFKTLTSEEYNEIQDSDALLRRLQHPRYLRITVRNAISADSFVSPSSTGAVGGFQQHRHPTTPLKMEELGSGPFAMQSTDASIVVEVQPTLARLHLHSSPTMPVWYHGDSARSPASSSDAPVPFAPTPSRPLLICEADLRRHGFQLGVELIGDVWTSPVGEQSEVAADSAVSSASSTASNAAVPRQHAPPNVALLNSFSIVEHHALDSRHHLYLKGGGVYRSHFVNYLFTVLLADPAVLQQHFFIHRHNDSFVSITMPPLPSSTGATRHRGVGRATAYGGVEETEADLRDAQQTAAGRAGRYTARRSTESANANATRRSSQRRWPAVRQFCKIEEVLFAVPGIATECRGCLLADTTFFVAGDLTGLWRFSRESVAPPLEGSLLAGPLVVPWSSAKAIPRQWIFDWVCPTAAAPALQRLLLEGESGGPQMTIVADIVLYRQQQIGGDEIPAAERPFVLLSSQPLLLLEVMSQHSRKNALMLQQQSAPLSSLSFVFNATNVEAAYTFMREDLLRHHRRLPSLLDYHRATGGGLVANASVFLKVCTSTAASSGADTGASSKDRGGKHRRTIQGTSTSSRQTAGAAVSGGTASSTSTSSCMIVSITDALVAVEEPRRPASSSRASSTTVIRRLARRWLLGVTNDTAVETTTGRAVGSWRIFIFSVLHHAYLSYLVYDMLPLLGVVSSGYRSGSGDSSTSSSSASSLMAAEESRTRVGLSFVAFVILFFSYASLPTVWLFLWVFVWSVYLYFALHRGSEMVLLFIASALYWRFLMV